MGIAGLRVAAKIRVVTKAAFALQFHVAAKDEIFNPPL